MIAQNKRKILLGIVSSILFAGLLAVLSRQTTALSVGIEVLPNPNGAISCFWVDSVGTTNRTASKSTATGKLTFQIPRHAICYGFELLPSDQSYHLKALSFEHILRFTASWINLNIQPDIFTLYDGSLYVGSSDTIDLVAPHGTTLVYKRFFESLLRLRRLLPSAWLLLLGGIVGILALIFLLPAILMRRLQSTANKMEDPCASRPRNPLYSPTVFVLCVCILSSLSIPAPVHPIETGLDPSWLWVINFFALDPHGIGTRLFFTSGPLGFIMHPLPIGHNVIIALLLNLIATSIFAAVLIHLFLSKQSNRPWMWCLLACLVIPPYWEWRWFIPLLLVWSTSCQTFDRKPRILAGLAISAGYLTIFVSLIKFTLAICAIATACVALLNLFCRNRRTAVRFGLLFLASLGTFGTIAIHHLFSSFSACLRWISTSWEIASGYSTAMPTVTESHDFLIPFVLVCGYIIFLNPLSRQFLVRLANVVILLPVLFFVFKYSITRCGLFSTCAFSFVLSWAIALSVIFAPTRTERVRSIGFLIFYWCLAIALGIASNFIQETLNSEPKTMGVSVSNLVKTVNLSHSIAQAEQQSRINLQNKILPSDWLTSIGTNSFQPYPIEMSYVPANHLNFIPFPIVQGYSAYTHRLDSQAASLYSSENAPVFILGEISSMDQRNMLLDTPAVWHAIRSFYKPIFSSQNQVLLRRTRRTQPMKLIADQKISVHHGDWTLNPASEQDLYVSIDWPQTTVGKILALGLRNTRCSLTLRRMDGTIRRYRITPDTLKTPFPINRIPHTPNDLNQLFSTATTNLPPVSAFKFDCEIPLYYEKTIDIRTYVPHE